jgi:hypothetical protein
MSKDLIDYILEDPYLTIIFNNLPFVYKDSEELYNSQVCRMLGEQECGYELFYASLLKLEEKGLLEFEDNKIRKTVKSIELTDELDSRIEKMKY